MTSSKLNGAIPVLRIAVWLPIIYQDVDSTARKTDGTFEVRHAAIQISAVLADQ